MILLKRKILSLHLSLVRRSLTSLPTLSSVAHLPLSLMFSLNFLPCSLIHQFYSNNCFITHSSLSLLFSLEPQNLSPPWHSSHESPLISVCIVVLVQACARLLHFLNSKRIHTIATYLSLFNLLSLFHAWLILHCTNISYGP